jgi:hypothetical protein
VKNSTIVSSGQDGVDSSKCILTLDSDIIANNNNDGIKLSMTTTYTITNSIVSKNGGNTGSPGVEITDSASTGTFAFNTVGGNGGTGAVYGGISCPNVGAKKLIEESIVAANAQNPATNGSQIAGQCQLQNVVTGPDAFTGGMQAAPAFVSNTDFHLDINGAALAANQACCIDRIPTIMTPNNNHDVDLTVRPKPPGTAWDIGAHEAK